MQVYSMHVTMNGYEIWSYVSYADEDFLIG